MRVSNEKCMKAAKTKVLSKLNPFVLAAFLITLQQVHDKLFAEHYRVWREREIKKGRGKRFPPTYYEKIEHDKQKNLCYEIIWQIGDMRDMGFVYTPEDANRAQDLLDEFTKYLLELPEVCVVTEKELNDPN